MSATDDLFGDPRLPARFWARVERTETCWLWTSYLDPDGYGEVIIDKVRHRSHIHAYSALVGARPPGLEIDHMCRVRHCVRPDHLQLVDKKRNGENRAGANRNSKSGIRGVSWDSTRKKWFVQAHSNRHSYPGGRYDSLDEAKAAALALRAKHFTNSLADREAQS